MALSKIFDRDNFIKLYKEIRYDNKKIKHSDSKFELVFEVIQHSVLNKVKDVETLFMLHKMSREKVKRSKFNSENLFFTLPDLDRLYGLLNPDHIKYDGISYFITKPAIVNDANQDIYIPVNGCVIFTINDSHCVFQINKFYRNVDYIESNYIYKNSIVK